MVMVAEGALANLKGCGSLMFLQDQLLALKKKRHMRILLSPPYDFMLMRPILSSTESCNPCHISPVPCQPRFLKVTIDFFDGTGSTILAERLGLSAPSSPTSTPNSPTVLCSGVSGPLLSTCGSGPLCSSISGKSGGIPCCLCFPSQSHIVSQKGSKTTIIIRILLSHQLPWGGRESLCKGYFQSVLCGSHLDA